MAYFKLKKTKWSDNSIYALDDEGMQVEDNERVPIQRKHGKIDWDKIKKIWWFEWKNQTPIDKHLIDMVELLSKYTSVCSCKAPKKGGHNPDCDCTL
jgi:hypothetical protein